MAPRSLRRAGGTAALTLALTAGTALGLVGAVGAYRSALGEPGTTTAVPAAATPTSPAATEAPTPTDPPTRWAPCIAPAVLEGGVCVTDVTRTVVVPDSSPSGRSHDDDGYDDDHGDEDHGDDDGYDDDGYDDDHGDEDHEDDDDEREDD